MATKTTNGNKVCSLSTFERNAYFYGKLLTTRDFEAEQQYSIDKGRTAHRLLHGTGIVCGLNVDVDKKALSLDRKKLKVDLGKGYALDCCGREIVVPADKQHLVSEEVQPGVEGQFLDSKKYYLYLEYLENEKEATQIPGEAAANAEESCHYGRVCERYKLSISQTQPARPRVDWLAEQAGEIYWHLFDVRPQYVGELDADHELSAELHKEFEDHHYVLAPKAQVKVEQARSRWKIEDADIEYLVCQENQALSVYLPLPCPRPKCSECNDGDAKVFLAVVDIDGKAEAKVNQEETTHYRSFVYSNALLRDMLFGHLADFDNPHRTTWKQVGAIGSLNGLSGDPDGNFKLNADKESAIQITPGPDLATITVSENHSAKIGNPHQTTAADVGALIGVNGVKNPGGYIALKADEGSAIRISTDPGPATITVSETHSLSHNPHNTLVTINDVMHDSGNLNLVSTDDSIEITPDYEKSLIDLKIAQPRQKQWPVIEETRWQPDQRMDRITFFNDGLKITFSEPMQELTLDTFIVTIELPERKGTNELCVRRSLIVDGKIVPEPRESRNDHDPETWIFKPCRITPQVLGKNKVRCRVVLKGNAILAADGIRHLDGDVFVIVDNGNLKHRTPSGDGREGGDFESWFYLDSVTAAEEPG